MYILNNLTPISRSFEIETSDYQPYIKYGENQSTWSLWVNGYIIIEISFKPIHLFNYTFFGSSRTDQTGRWIFTVMAQTTRTHTKMCFGGCVNTATHLGGQVPKTTNLGA